jgi:hypothetical protein
MCGSLVSYQWLQFILTFDDSIYKHMPHALKHTFHFLCCHTQKVVATTQEVTLI